MEKQFLDQFTDGMQRAQEPLKVRCPECLKLFSIKTEKIIERRPEFQCSGCKTSFWIPYPEVLGQGEVLGFPMNWEESSEASIEQPPAERTEAKSVPAAPGEAATAPCARCGFENPLKATDCQKCGVILQVAKERAEDREAGFKVSNRLRDLWKEVINRYDDMVYHERFIQNCREEKALDYAAYRYNRVLKACAGDEISLKMLEKIEKLLASQMVAPPPTAAAASGEAPKSKMKIGSSLTMLALGLGIVLILAGYFIPNFRNMVGVGVAILFLTLAFRSSLK